MMNKKKKEGDYEKTKRKKKECSNGVLINGVRKSEITAEKKPYKSTLRVNSL